MENNTQTVLTIMAQEIAQALRPWALYQDHMVSNPYEHSMTANQHIDRYNKYLNRLQESLSEAYVRSHQFQMYADDVCTDTQARLCADFTEAIVKHIEAIVIDGFKKNIPAYFLGNTEKDVVQVMHFVKSVNKDVFNAYRLAMHLVTYIKTEIPCNNVDCE